MAPKTAPYKRENIPANRLEMDMLEYQLKEAREVLDKRNKELERVTGILDRVTKVADQRIEKTNYLNQINVKLSKRITYWKLVAIVEAVVMVTYIIIQGV